MTIRRREYMDGPRFDGEGWLPNRSKRPKTFESEREARVFEASLDTKSAASDVVVRLSARSAPRLDVDMQTTGGTESNRSWRLARRGRRPPVPPGPGQRNGRSGP